MTLNRLIFTIAMIAMPGFALAQSDTGAGDAHETSPQQNVRESEQYDTMVRDNSGYRQSRIKAECGGLSEDLRQQCVASFKTGDDAAAAPTHHHHSHKHATPATSS